MTNKEAIKYLIPPVATSTISSKEYLKQKEAYELAIKALNKDKCSTCKHYDADYGDTCLNPSGTCKVFEYDGYEPKGE